MVRTRCLHSVFTVLASLALVLALTGLPTIALADSSETGVRPQSTGPGGNTRLPRQAGQALTAPRAALASVDEVVTACIEAVNLATSSNRGRPTTTGTLRTDAAGRTTYRPVPADALVLTDASGSRAQFVVSAMNGESSDPEDFLYGDHQAECRFSAGEDVDLRVQSIKVGTDQLRTIQGTGPVDATPWAVDVTLTSRRIDDLDNYSFQYADRVSGTMETDGLRLTVDERSEKEGVYMDERSVTVVNSQWQEGAARYRFSNLTYSTQLTNGRPDISGYTAQGSVLANGRAIGQAEMRITSSSMILQLAGASGRVVLSAWTR
jgi:hypothetical protein